MGALQIVGLELWKLEGEIERQPVVRPPQREATIPSGFAVREPFTLDEESGAESTLGHPRPAGPHVLRVLVRAPGDGLVDEAISLWDMSTLAAALTDLGLDARVLEKQLDPTGLRRLHFGGVQTPFLMLAPDDRPCGYATLTILPMASNVLVEIEHGRTSIGGALGLEQGSFHQMNAHPYWRGHLGDAPGLAAALGLRALTTIDRGVRAVTRRSIELESAIADTVTADVRTPELEKATRDTTAELLSLIGLTGGVVSRLQSSRDLGVSERGRSIRPRPYDRCMRELERLAAEVAALRSDLRAVARTAADAAGMLGLIEQQLENKRAATLQRTVTLIAAIVLLPGLVASIYGANIAVPGRDRTAGTFVLILGMLAVGMLSAWVLSALDREQDATWIRPARQRWFLLTAILALVMTAVISLLNS